MKAIVTLAFGIAFGVILAAVMSFYGVMLDPGGILMTRFLAACLIGIGFIFWFNRSADFNALKSITLSLLPTDMYLCGRV